MERLPLYAIGTGVFALVIAMVLYLRVKAAPEGGAAMQRIARYIREGAMAFLAREYKVLAIYAVVVAAALFFAFQSQGLGGVAALSFLAGAFQVSARNGSRSVICFSKLCAVLPSIASSFHTRLVAALSDLTASQGASA